MEKLREEILDISKIMTESFEMILNREKNLGRMSEMSHDLKNSSDKFKKDAKKMRLMFWLRHYATYIAVGMILIFFIYLRVYVF